MKLVVNGVETEVEITPEQLQQGDLVLVKIGNDNFPAFDPEQIRECQRIIGGALHAAGVRKPILVWNHAIDISTISLKNVPQS